MILVISHFGLEGGICLLIAPVPVYCFLITFFNTLLTAIKLFSLDLDDSWRSLERKFRHCRKFATRNVEKDFLSLLGRVVKDQTSIDNELAIQQLANRSIKF